MNILHDLDKKGHRLTETSFWVRDGAGTLVRNFTGVEVVHATPYKYLFNTDQGITEAIFEKHLISKGQKVQRFMELLHYEYNPDEPEWPLTAYIKNNASGAIEAWQTKYILGSDGARSATRRASGIQSSSQGGEDVWAVADVYVDTNFPDYRRRCAIRTPDGGCMLIPRKDEGLRIFLQVDEKNQESLDASKSHVQDLLSDNSAFKLTKTVQSHISKVIHPYQMNITDIVWISQYRVAQRLVHSFCDPTTQRVFLLGDACHTHSPKAGQGMNVSISDSYNLTWKLALVLKGFANASLLDTYEQERLWVAQQLIEFDALFARQFGQKDKLESQNLRETWEMGHGFTSGCGYKYPPNSLVNPVVRTPISNKAIEPLVPGKRLLPIDLIRHIDGNHVHLLDIMPSNGRFHLFIFAGNLLLSPTVQKLGESLDSPQSPMSLFNLLPLELMQRFHHEDITTDPVSSTNRSYVLDLFLVHSHNHLDIPLGNLPPPFSTKWPMQIYSDSVGAAQSQLGVPENLGALAVVRPDGYIGLVTGLDNLEDVTSYFDGFMSRRI
ncbi:Monooxygenase, FAD-binding [Penicillium griseofulvum]|uniref:Monooxygenase, FAD-binding n=1 Tax=Penicillium patulum TaxID=5078 RepID=A0A135LER7_PENPA|nr:Monooxygenase, FAD-binding [Penicillium griseofulvum]KXG47494.1 Monooxygenase, FAD-binding [Penicillium griseofulvum]